MNVFSQVRKKILSTPLSQNRLAYHFNMFIKPCSLHSSCTLYENEINFDPKIVNLKPNERPVDWLPFPWTRRPLFSVTEQSGDTIRANIIDTKLPKPDFEFSEELKDADELVKQYFSLQTGSKAEMKEVCRRHLLKRVQRHPIDFTSLEVRIAEMTIKVRALFEHKEKYAYKKEVHRSRILLPIMVQKRNKLLNQLYKIDTDRFHWLLDELEVWFNPPTLSLKMDRYTKKWDLRRLTKEYCEKMIADKKADYHDQLKTQQKAFLEEKRRTLEWIAQEEKALGIVQKTLE